ncbi:MAG: T9SS type A sorting domain-containing protein [Ignavibacteriaceae bacterium]|nr:T9SS type A sorting domain-containing protein [Ignavibacteriaceae bacterium]
MKQLFFLFSFLLLAAGTLQAQNYQVSGAGTAGVNGVYVNDGTLNGKPHYTLSGSPSYYMYFHSDTERWVISDVDNGMFHQSLYFNFGTDATPPAANWYTNQGSNPAPSVAIAAPKLTYSGAGFSESMSNDGSIENTLTITHNNFDGATFTGSNGDNFVSGGKATVTNLPSGLTAVITRTSATTLSVSLSGNASAHGNANDVSNLTIAFQNSAFSGGDASAVVNAAKSDLTINFSELVEVGTGQTYTTIASAIAAASDGDILNLAAQTFTENALTLSNKSLRFKGQGAANTIIQGAASYNTASDRIMTVSFDSYAASNTLQFEGLTLRYGKKAQPYEVSGSTGGAVKVTNANVIIRDCELYGNIASVQPPHGWYGEGGGALALFSSNLTAANSTFADNVFSSAWRPGDWMGGGAILFMQDNNDPYTMTLTNCTFSGNTSSVYGGAIFMRPSNVVATTITNCTFANNAGGNGGAFSSDNSSGNPQPVTFRNTIFHGNTASNQGPQMWAGNSTAYTFENCMNQSSGFYNISGNFTNCLTGQNPLLSALADNGGPTRTMALQTGSPAIDAGTSTGAPAQDQRGYYRSGAADIGSYEFGGTVSLFDVAVYLTRNNNEVSENILYPKVGFGSPITSPFSWTPASPDWTYNAPKCTIYVVPTGSEGMVASSFVVNFDATKATLSAAAGDNNLFDSGIFYTQVTGTGRLKVNASNISSAINMTPGSGKYLARLIFTMLKPGHMEITLDSLDFRQYDIAANEQVSLVTEDHGAEVKFYLGDFASSGDQTTGDGLINVNDLSLFAGSYWSNHAQVSTLYKSKYDVGPTNASGNYFALPTADGNINFEDLIIFSVGYGKSAGNELPKVKVNPINVTLGEEIVGNTVRVPVYLSGSVEDVRGLSFSFRTGMTLKGVEKAGGLNNENGFVIFRQEDDLVQIDAAVIGADNKAISAEGIIAYLVFENKSSLELEAVIARNSFNQDIPVLMKGNSALSITPDAYALSQNYPNPFNPSTAISFALPQASEVTLKIYNTLGQEVAVLINGETMEAGIHTKAFDAGNLTSGVYIYKLTAGSFSAVKKMNLLK